MSNYLFENHDQVSNEPLVTPDGLPKDAAPTDNTPADPTDQPIEAALPEAPGTPDPGLESSDPQSGGTPVSDPQSNDENSTDQPVSGTPEASVPPTTNAPKAKQPRAKRPNRPDREHKLLKTDRSGIGGVKTPEGKAVSSRNNLKHGMYSRLPFYLLPDESQEEYDALHDRLRTLYPPIDESSAQMLEMHVQAFYRLGRCNHAEFLAETSDRTDLDKFVRRIGNVGMHRTRCERSYYLHLDKLKQVLADYKQRQDDIREQPQDEEMEPLEEEEKPKPRFNADGEEMDPAYPQTSFWKISCLPESQCNEVLEFDRTLKGKMSVKRTPMREWEGGWMLHPSVKPRTMKGEWPDYALGRYKDYYNSRKAEDIKNLTEDIKNL